LKNQENETIHAPYYTGKTISNVTELFQNLTTSFRRRF